MQPRFLTALPVYNEAPYVDDVLDAVARYAEDVLVVDDGSTDGTGRLLAARKNIHVTTHASNRGYGTALITAFDYATANRYEVLVTIDCDGQHEPQRIPALVAALAEADIVSGSRYLEDISGDSPAPRERREINEWVTQTINSRLGLHLTDAFCGLKAYRVAALSKLELTEPGYAMPLELWVQAVGRGLRIVELPVPRVYLDESRSFGGAMDDGETRLAHYRAVLDRALAAAAPVLGTAENRPRTQTGRFSRPSERETMDSVESAVEYALKIQPAYRMPRNADG